MMLPKILCRQRFLLMLPNSFVLIDDGLQDQSCILIVTAGQKWCRLHAIVPSPIQRKDCISQFPLRLDTIQKCNPLITQKVCLHSICIQAFPLPGVRKKPLSVQQQHLIPWNAADRCKPLFHELAIHRMQTHVQIVSITLPLIPYYLHNTPKGRAGIYN